MERPHGPAAIVASEPIRTDLAMKWIKLNARVLRRVTRQCDRVHAGCIRTITTSCTRKPSGAVTSFRSAITMVTHARATAGGDPDASLPLPAGRVHPVCIA
jgi:hypothetical protein